MPPLAPPSSLYTPSAYYCSKVVVGLPFAALNILTLAFTIYGLAGLELSGTQGGEWAPPLVEHAIIVTLGYLVANQV